MKLICEVLDEVKLITEEKEDGKKDFFIEGIFMQADLKNRNGRIYPMPVMEKEVNRYVKEYVDTKRAFGELGHPEGPQINLDRVSHMITELKRDGSNIIGRAKILETPMGNIARNIMQGGGAVGVSSRGLGSLKEKNGIMEVQDDFTLATAADIVADPSAPGAFVSGIMEGVEWVWDNGLLKAQQIELYKEEIEKAAAKPNKRALEEAMLRTWSDFLSKL
jgi:hypothetical protein